MHANQDKVLFIYFADTFIGSHGLRQKGGGENSG